MSRMLYYHIVQSVLLEFKLPGKTKQNNWLFLTEVTQIPSDAVVTFVRYDEQVQNGLCEISLACCIQNPLTYDQVIHTKDKK